MLKVKRNGLVSKVGHSLYVHVCVCPQTWCLSLVWRPSYFIRPWCWRRGSLSTTLGLRPYWNLQGAFEMQTLPLCCGGCVETFVCLLVEFCPLWRGTGRTGPLCTRMCTWQTLSWRIWRNAPVRPPPASCPLINSKPRHSWWSATIWTVSSWWGGESFTQQYAVFVHRLCRGVCRSRREQQIRLVWCVCAPPRQCHHSVPECQRYSLLVIWFHQTGTVIPSHWRSVSLTEAMAMGKLHKDIGHLIVQSAEDPERSDSQVIKVSIPNILLDVTCPWLWPDSFPLIHRIFLSRPKRSCPTWWPWLTSVKTLKSHWKA